MANTDAYHAIRGEADRCKLPQNWQEDLTTKDRRVLNRSDAPQHFAWVLRTNGTHLYHGDTATIIEWLRSTAANFGGNEIHWYWYDGERLIEYRSAEALIRKVQEANRDRSA